MKLSEGITLSKMADKLNVSYAQIRNLKDLKVEKPTFTTAIKFFIALRASEEKRNQLMKTDYPEMFRIEQEKQDRAPAGTVDPEYSCKTSYIPLAYRIYALANCDCGLERKTVTRLWGEAGEDLLNELVREEILQEKDGMVTSFSEKHRDTDREIVRRKQSHCLHFLDLNDPDSWLTLITQSVDGRAYQQIKDEAKEFFYKIDAIVTDPNNRGGIPLFFNMNLGKLLKGETV
jgi:transcriptional regulator with XRE-family HTH domain